MEQLISIFNSYITQENVSKFLEKFGVPVAVGIAAGAVVFTVMKCIPILFSKDDTEDPDYFISKEEAKELRERCKKLNFSAVPDFWLSDIEEIKECYDGIGPSKWSPKFRKFVAKMLAPIEGSVMIHDYEWKNCDKTLFSFLMINLKFSCNSIREAKAEKKWKIAFMGIVLAILNSTLGWKLFKTSSL